MLAEGASLFFTARNTAANNELGTLSASNIFEEETAPCKR